MYLFTACSQGVSGLTGTPETLRVPVTHVFGVPVPDPTTALHNIIEINRAALQYHAQECHSHPYASLWYTWPVMEHPVLFYYDQPPGSTRVSAITDMGNPAVWWLSIPALLFCVWRATRGPAGWPLDAGAPFEPGNVRSRRPARW